MPVHTCHQIYHQEYHAVHDCIANNSGLHLGDKEKFKIIQATPGTS